jgi:hypothetical protein
VKDDSSPIRRLQYSFPWRLALSAVSTTKIVDVLWRRNEMRAVRSSRRAAMRRIGRCREWRGEWINVMI